MTAPESLRIGALLAGYRAGDFGVAAVMERALAAAEASAANPVWITRLSREQIMRYVAALERRPAADLALYGIPFVIKDNIDLAGVPTTAACPGFAYTPAQSAPVVQRLIEHGAIPLGKTNMDQFATGLVGTRSPFGACRNSFNPDYISGGSSAGSAVAVALGFASFALGTDTAGSGRVPAAFNNLVGLKPALGRLSTRGVVPACRSLDCVSIFALTCDDAAAVLEVAAGFDAADPYARAIADRPLAAGGTIRFGLPPAAQLDFFGDEGYARAFAAAAARLESLGATAVPVDLTPFLETARLLYEGPWVAERYAAVGRFMESHPGALLPVTAAIIGGGRSRSAVDAFEGQYRLRELQRVCTRVWDNVDVLLTPTAPSIYTIAAVEADPITLNACLGRYTNFMNLLDLVGVAVPGGWRADGLPFGVTLAGRPGMERDLLRLADRLHRASVQTLGALPIPFDAAVPTAATAATPATVATVATAAAPITPTTPDCLPLAVCGAHMADLPLNHQLRERGGRFLRRLHTAPHYRFYALAGGPPHRPGLVRVADGGAPIEVEVWELPLAEFGGFVRLIPAPLGIGQVELDDGSRVPGFLCEGYAAAAAADITAFGGWRAFLAAK